MTSVVCSHAQEFGLGIKAGGDIAKVNSISFQDDFSTFLTAGVFGYIRPINRLGLRVEANVNQLHITTRDGFFTKFDTYIKNPSARDAEFRFLEFALPLIVDYKIIRPLTFELGVQYNAILSVNDYDEVIRDKRTFFRQSYISLLVGSQLFLTKRLSLNARYIRSFDNFNNSDVRERWQIGRYQFSLQYHLIRRR